MTIDVRFNLLRGEFNLDVRFTIPNTGVTAVFGPSGCGKTTLLRAMAGLEYCQQGFLSLDGDIWHDDRRFVPTHQRSLGYVFQEANLFPHLSVQGNLEYGYKRLPMDLRTLEFDKIVTLLGLDSLLHRLPSQLSGGERQRVAVGRALLTSPRLLLMDEPMSALDTNSKNEIYPFLERLHQELAIPVLYVSHSLDEVARLGNHLIVMEAGQVLASGPIANMFTRSDLPLIHGQGAESLIEAQVSWHDDEFQLTYLTFAGGQFTVPRTDVPQGRAVRLRVPARDVSLTLQRQSDTSILNIFPATVEDIVEESPAQLTIRLNANGVVILSRITRKSAAVLELEKGKAVYAQIKSVAILA
ncbi:MAG: molybdenum ABC transporter ATP-binding protein [Gammaproteobacteria bacterium]|jgi:molybdate transport system ATP-binding protein